VVKSKEKENYLQDLCLVFERLRRLRWTHKMCI
jgi:hypothetical protein